MVENCRVDTVERRCNVDPAKIDVMINKVASFATTVTKLQGNHCVRIMGNYRYCYVCH